MLRSYAAYTPHQTQNEEQRRAAAFPAHLSHYNVPTTEQPETQRGLGLLVSRMDTTAIVIETDV